MHWSKLPTSNTAKSAIQYFHTLVLSKTGFSRERWETYHQEMLAFRDKYVAHMDLRNPFTDPVPCFDHALQVAYAYEEWGRELTKEVIWGQPTLSSQYERWKDEVFSIATREPRS
jgi:hypothetical protein